MSVNSIVYQSCLSYRNMLGQLDMASLGQMYQTWRVPVGSSKKRRSYTHSELSSPVHISQCMCRPRALTILGQWASYKYRMFDSSYSTICTTSVHGCCSKLRSVEAHIPRFDLPFPPDPTESITKPISSATRETTTRRHHCEEA